MATIFLMYEVGLGDSPMRIAQKLTGDPHRYRELLKANPHKAIVHIDGRPTFASLGVGERIALPPGFVGDFITDVVKAGASAAKVSAAPPKHHILNKESDCKKGAKLLRVSATIVPKALLPAYVNPQDSVTMCWGGTSGGFANPFDSAAKGFEAAAGGIVDVVKAPAEAIAMAAAPIPVIGDIARIASSVHGDVTNIVSDASTAPFRYAKAIAEGTPLDKVALDALKDQIRIAKEAAPYAQMVISFVPGIGTGVSAAIGGGLALAEGKGIDEAAKAAIKSALPGGPAAAAAFETALDVAAGENVAQSALENARELVPAGPARQAYDIGLAVITGQKIQDALVQGFMQMGSSQMQSMAADWVKQLAGKPGFGEMMDRMKALPADTKSGYALAMAALSKEGVGEKALTALRGKLAPQHREGFDAALKAMEQIKPWVSNVTHAPRAPSPPPAAKRPPSLTSRQSPESDLQKLAKMSPTQLEQLRQLQALAALSPEEQKALAALTPAEQKALAAMKPADAKKALAAKKAPPKLAAKKAPPELVVKSKVPYKPYPAHVRG